MAWCRQSTSHYLSQCRPRSLSPYGVTRPQWVNTFSRSPIEARWSTHAAVKSRPGPVQTYCQLGYGNKLPWNLNNISSAEKRLKMSSARFRPYCTEANMSNLRFYKYVSPQTQTGYSDVMWASWRPKTNDWLFVQQQRKYQISALLVLCEGNHWGLMDSPPKGPVMWEGVPSHDVTMETESRLLIIWFFISSGSDIFWFQFRLFNCHDVFSQRLHGKHETSDHSEFKFAHSYKYCLISSPGCTC